MRRPAKRPAIFPSSPRANSSGSGEWAASRWLEEVDEPWRSGGTPRRATPSGLDPQGFGSPWRPFPLSPSAAHAPSRRSAASFTPSPTVHSFCRMAGPSRPARWPGSGTSPAGRWPLNRAGGSTGPLPRRATSTAKRAFSDSFQMKEPCRQGICPRRLRHAFSAWILSSRFTGCGLETSKAADQHT